MAKTSITTTISQKELNLKPGSSSVSFEVIAVNDSDRFATFQLELLAPGAESAPRRHWYEIAPEISTKTPPGDRTRFQVTITDTPIPGFAGVMNLTIRTFSLELGEDRKLLRLTLEPGADIPLKLELPVKQFQASPLDQIDIPVRIHNPSYRLTEVTLSLIGISGGWLTGGTEQRLRLEAGDSGEIVFTCLLPETIQTKSGRYLFTVEASQQHGLSSSVSGSLEIQPVGFLEFDCNPLQHHLPPKGSGIRRWWADLATYQFLVKNESNAVQDITLQIQGEDQALCVFQVFPDRPTLMPGEKLPIALTANTRRPWWGLAKPLLFQVKGIVSDTRVALRNDNPVLKLQVSPVLPLWLQILLTFLLLFLLWKISWLNPSNPLFTHQDKVNSVQFNGTAEEIVSGSDDQTLIQWRSAGFLNPLIKQQVGVFGRAKQSIQVVRYRPIDNDWVAAGLENGDIQLWRVQSNQAPSIFSDEKGDRVRGLEFTRDSRYLFSGHGSGRVLQWDLSQHQTEASLPQPQQPVTEKNMNFAIYGMALTGIQEGKEDTLAIGGRYNSLKLWNWVTDQSQAVPYSRPGGQDDYLTSVATAEHRPYLLATSDNQGYISLWDLRSCLNGDRPCKLLDEWQGGKDGKPVRSVALSGFGCYLASGGADGRLMVWTLTREGRRSPDFLDGIEVDREAKPFNSVDIKTTQRKVAVTSGNDDRLVRYLEIDRQPTAQCDQPDQADYAVRTP
ncbi:MAG: hypothetical protein SFW36_08005 [Leptolyngbyaceae cyanobacterium bins.59]|nr:hypothetical protein [Leptolyngbyaceae cyanobacterium bins.59]